MGESGGRAVGRPMAEVELDLEHAMAGADGVDRHPDLHPEAVRERQHVPQDARAKGALPGDRRPCAQPAPATDRPAGESHGQAQPAAYAPREHGHRDVRVSRAHRPRQLLQGARGRAEIAVTQDEHGLAVPVRADAAARRSAVRRLLLHGVRAMPRRLPPERRSNGQRGGAALADHPLAANHHRAGPASDLGRRVGGAVVGHPQRRAGKGERERGQRLPDALGLVVYGDDDERVAGHDRSAAQAIVSGSSKTPLEVRVAEVQAHITGTVWKIECAVGDRIQEGDTVAILESMKMEMPVEAEDDGTVAEIRCEEGQAVSEGDTLVVLA